MSPSAPPPDSRRVRLERLLPGSQEYVWRYLTEPELLAEWLGVSRLELREGGRVELEPLRTEGTEQRPSGRIVQGVVTRCEPPRVLSFTWSDATTPHSEVTLELVPRGEKVRLVLTHWSAPVCAMAHGTADSHRALDALASYLDAALAGGRTRSRRAARSRQRVTVGRRPHTAARWHVLRRAA
ncbi:SRPBCC domain-containing protein [Myxococcus sp. RHSTA-1-4]|uniref:SRPBCC domain-containing protein n=1 Tax=Myxococcus sp. RHSTA-1-4 TaxID=2874601 RepID=UPI001CBD3F2F|nr:SRPBCC domain-containing protein [Myxococcus sp. RHSTA-1-4]MBZ4415741.1 SRPBCC domain-containing protein [Myxococcus sp. RHSTA-1-4]